MVEIHIKFVLSTLGVTQGIFFGGVGGDISLLILSYFLSFTLSFFVFICQILVSFIFWLFL